MKRIKIFLVSVGQRMQVFAAYTPPLGLMYLASYLRKIYNAEIKIINQQMENLSNDELIRQIIDFEADYIGLRALTPTAQNLPYITKQLKSSLPKALTLIGGPHAASFRDMALENTEADIVVPGEGELAFEKIIEAHQDGDDFSDIPGIIWRNKKGEIISNPGEVPFVPDLDSLPFPAYDLIDITAYWKKQSFPPIPRRKYASLFSSRGCPYQCIYCHKIFGSRYRFHSAERIVDEIEHLQTKYGIIDFEFIDDIFNLNHKRLIEFCELVKKRNLKTKLVFPNGVRTDILREEEIKALVDTGLYFSSFALESGSPRIQKLIKKNLDIPKFVENVEKATRLGVFAYGFAMFGFPTETAYDMKLTRDVAWNSRLHSSSFFTVTPFPNTVVYEIAKETCPEQLDRLDYNNMEYADMVVNLSSEPDEVLFHFQREANRKYVRNPRRLLRILKDHPQPQMLPLYIPAYLTRLTKGLFKGSSPKKV